MSDVRPPMPPMGGGGAPPMGGRPPGGGPSSAVAAVEKNRSILNPTDAATMGARGQMDPNMSIRDWLGQFGVDVEGPVVQLQQFMKKQSQNANPLTKMQNIAQGGGGAPAGAPRAPMGGSPPQRGGAPPQQGVADLMGGMRR